MVNTIINVVSVGILAPKHSCWPGAYILCFFPNWAELIQQSVVSVPVFTVTAIIQELAVNFRIHRTNLYAHFKNKIIKLILN